MIFLSYIKEIKYVLLKNLEETIAYKLAEPIQFYKEIFLYTVLINSKS
jgi:hypothetical protein